MSGTEPQASVRPAAEDQPAEVELRIRLRQLRRQRGLAQRDLTKPLHLASHTAIVDYESGRRVPAPDILEAYERFFDLPDGELQRLRERALVQRADAEATVRLSAGARLPAVPRQLPPAPTHFAGRAGDLATLDDLVGPTGSPSAVVISAIAGMGGVGKTALAIQWGHRMRDRFPDGDLYVNLRGFHPAGVPMAPDEALGLLLNALGVAGERIPPTVDERAGLYRSVLAERRMLLVLDNAADVDQVRPLLPGAPGCVVLVTSRNRLAGLVARDGARRIVLDVLSADEAHELLSSLIGEEATAAEPDATAELAERCGRHPLALRVAAERVAAARKPSIPAVVAELADRDRRLSLLAAPEDEESAVRSVIGWSYDRLSPRAARLFRLLGLHDGPDLPAAAAAALSGEVPTGCLGELVAAHLLAQPVPGRYARHDLLQLYAAEAVRTEESVGQRAAAVRRLAGWYLHSACAARVALSPSLPPMQPEPVRLPVPPARFDSPAEALAWFEAERANLVAVVRLAETYKLGAIMWQLPTAMYGFFDLRKYYADWIATHEIALRGARRMGDREAEGRILCNLGNAYRPLRREEEAIGYYRRALELFRQVGYRQGEAKVLGNIGSSYDYLERWDEAEEAQQQSLDIFRELGDRFGEALSLTNLGEMYVNLGRYEQAADHHRVALDLFRQLGDGHGTALATSNLGLALARMGELGPALELDLEALAMFRELGDRNMVANVLRDLGDIHRGLGRPAEATGYWREALELYEAIGDQRATLAVRERLS